MSLTPCYQDSYCQVFHGDCREVIPSLEFDLIISDPPYGISHPTNYAARGRGKLAICNDYAPVHLDDEPFDPYFLISLGKPTCLWGANHYASRLPDASGWVVWDKERPDSLDQATCELAWTNFVKGVRRYRHLWNGMMRASEHGENYHPTQKPVALYVWLFSLPWTPAGVALDTHMGSGPMLVAAKKLGRKAIGVEISEAYCEVTAKRLELETTLFDLAEQRQDQQQELLQSPTPERSGSR